MFFCIGPVADSRFPNNYKIDSLWFNCDNGWREISAGKWYKGYPENYCQIEFDSTGARVLHDQFRSFPLWHNHHTVTNLVCPEATQQIWADDQCVIDHTGQVKVNKVSLDLTIADRTISVAEAQQQIQTILDSTVQSFFDQFDIEPKVFLSGGVDTLLIYSLLHSHEKNMSLVKESIYEQDHFVQTNQQILKSYWAYCQFHHWLQPVWLATGSHGDEYLLRGPETIALLTAWHDIEFEKILLKNPHCYHYKYFLKEKNLQIFRRYWEQRHELQTTYDTKEKLIQQILNILVNDHQHWHLGNTLTWTPLRNIQLAKILLQCDIQALLPQFLDASISKALIDVYQPGTSQFASNYKNFDHTQNLDSFLANIL
jgi:hypothetical protein